MFARTTKGLRVYLATPRLRALLGLNLTAAAAGAMVLVNTVVIVRDGTGGSDAEVAVTLSAYGLGSVLAALLLIRLLQRLGDRTLMILGGLLLTGVLALTGVAFAAQPSWPLVLIAWVLLGVGTAVVQTPAGRLVRRSARAGDWPVLFAAQFTLSHAAWLLAYLVAGTVGAHAGLAVALFALAALAGAGMLWSQRVWPRQDDGPLEHLHDDLDPGDPHLRDAVPARGGWRHSHTVLIDRIHPKWPT